MFRKKVKSMFKYKIGDELQMTITGGSIKYKNEREFPVIKHKLVPIERLYQECPGGIQIHYLCRVHMMDSSFARNTSSFGLDYVRINEVELEFYKDLEPIE